MEYPRLQKHTMAAVAVLPAVLLMDSNAFCGEHRAATLQGAQRPLPHAGMEDSKDGMGFCLTEHRHDTADMRKSPGI